MIHPVDETVLRTEMADVAELFDAEFYVAANPDLKLLRGDPLRDFCVEGWRHRRKPRRDFDVWWYWANHLDPAEEQVNPLVHYARSGRAAGLSTRPDPQAMGVGVTLPTARPIRRACLFAAFDADGIVDDATLLYLRELARFADVFCLYDCYLQPGELAKLDGVVTQAWSVRHGAYDFGSYSLLAKDLVGWDRLRGYDEVLFVNDSCYLVRPLDDVFARMDAQACDWWGLQATKGLAATSDAETTQFTEPIPLDRVREKLLARYEDDEVYDFHVGSYFLAFRQPVLEDEVFRRLIDSVATERGKMAIIQKYEIGITHLLIGRGHAFSTYVSALYPFHPMFTEWAFELIAQGFPLLKRLLLYLNHYDVPDLAEWKQRVAALVPDAPLDLFEAHLLRTSPEDQLARSFAIRRGADGEALVPDVPIGRDFGAGDKAVAKRPDCWVFAVDPMTNRLPDNSRAIFDQVADDPDLTKIVLTRSRSVRLDGRNVVIEPLLSAAGREHLRAAGVVLVAGRPFDALGARVSPVLHHLLDVREGLRLTKHAATAGSPRIGSTAVPSATGKLEMLHPVRRRTLSALLTASAVDHAATVASMFPARYADAWRTGLPLHDHLLVADLPPDLAAEETQIRALLDGRRLLLVLPAVRSGGSSVVPRRFGAQEVDHLRGWAERNDVVIGVREPGSDFDRPYTRLFGDTALDLSPARFGCDPAVLRVADALLTDYSGSALDFTVTGRPVLSLAYDLDDVRESLLYDLDHLFPGPVCRDADGFAAALDGLLDPPPAVRRQYARVRDLLIDHRDGQSAARVVERLRQTVGVAVLEGRSA